MTAPRVLCINPWVYDFTAYDLWSKPLGLSSIAALLRERGMDVHFSTASTNGIHASSSGKIGPHQRYENMALAPCIASKYPRPHASILSRVASHALDYLKTFFETNLRPARVGMSYF